MTVTGEDIVAQAREWLGVKWRHQGRNRAGIDCAGLLLAVASHFDLPRGDMVGYRRDPSFVFVQNIRSHTLPCREILHGSIGIFHDTLQPCHTGIFNLDASGRVTVIHAEADPKGYCHEQDFDADHTPMRARLAGIRLFKGVDYVL